MERPIYKDIGTDILQLDTPSLFVDLDALSNNLTNANDYFLGTNKKLCPSVSEHGVPAIANMQTSENLTSSEIYVDTFSQGKHFSQNGFTKILIGASPTVPKRLQYIPDLCTNSEITVLVREMGAISDIADVLGDGLSSLSVLIPITLSSDIWGLRVGDECARLAEQIGNYKWFNFRGYFLDLDQLGITDKIDYRDEINGLKEILSHLESIGREIVVKSRDIEQILMETPYRFTSVTGLYPFRQRVVKGDSDTVTCGIVSTVMSVPEKGRAYLDCGQKAISIDKGLPTVAGLGASYIEAMSAEHGYFVSDRDLPDIELGQRVVLLPSDIGGAFNVHDLVYMMENKMLRSVWEISSRGHFS